MVKSKYYEGNREFVSDPKAQVREEQEFEQDLKHARRENML